MSFVFAVGLLLMLGGGACRMSLYFDCKKALGPKASSDEIQKALSSPLFAKQYALSGYSFWIGLSLLGLALLLVVAFLVMLVILVR